MNFCNKEIIEKIDSFIDEHRLEIVYELMELVKIPSVRGMASETAPFGQECKRVIKAVEELYERHGFKSKAEKNNNYVISYFGNNSDKQIGVFSHADVVPADGEWLITNPFKPIIKDGYMFGRGCNDDKSGIIQALYAAEIIKALELPLKSELVMFTGSNEETGMADMTVFCENEKMPDVSLVPDGEYPFYSGEKNIVRFDIISKKKIEKIKKFQGGKASNIVLGEIDLELDYSAELWNEIQCLCENDSNFILEHSGETIFVKVKGKSNHIARINDSVNAAGVAAEMLLKCNNVSDNDKLLLRDILKFIDGGYGAGFGIEHSDEEFGKLVCGNGIVNITPDGKLRINFDVRSSPFLDTDELIEKIKKTVKPNWDIEILRNSKGYLINENECIPKVIKDIYSYLSGSSETKALKTSGGTYSRMLKNAYSIGNIAQYKAGPISLPDGHGGFHQPDEKLSIDGFLEGIKILVCMIMEIDSLLN